MMLSPSLSPEVWQTLYAMMNGERPPFHIERKALHAFETAMKAAQDPPPRPEIDPA